MIGHAVWYKVLLPTSGTPLAYHADKYRVTVDTGVLAIYERRPHVVFPGDNDALVVAYGLGQWLRLEIDYDRSV